MTIIFITFSIPFLFRWYNWRWCYHEINRNLQENLPIKYQKLPRFCHSTPELPLGAASNHNCKIMLEKYFGRRVNSKRHVRKEDLARSRNLRLMGVFGFPSLLILLLLSLFLAYGKLTSFESHWTQHNTVGPKWTVLEVEGPRKSCLSKSLFAKVNGIFSALKTVHFLFQDSPVSRIIDL